MKAFAPVRTVAPEGALVSLAEAKAHLKVEHDDEDTLIEALIAAASAQLDGYAGILGQALLTQTWEQSFNGFPDARCLRLALGPVGETVGIAYYDSENVSRSFTSATVMSDAIGPLIVLDGDASWPATYERPDAVNVTWTCGFGDEPADVPENIRRAALLLVGHLYVNREAVVTGTIAAALPLAFGWLIDPHGKDRV